MRKPKFDKHKCLTCMFHGTNNIGWTVHNKAGGVVRVYCNYATITGQICTSRNGDDLRGDEYNDCKLYQEGTPPRIEENMEYLKLYKEGTKS